jgi:uncharacterized protein (DUF1778 family)
MNSQQATTPETYARLSCRVSARIKSRAEEAAAILGQSMTDFTESALADKAQAVLDQHERIILSERDFAQFVASLESPKPPTEKLKQAMDAYQKLKAEHPERNL